MTTTIIIITTTTIVDPSRFMGPQSAKGLGQQQQ